MQETVRAPKAELKHPALFRVCFDSLAPVQLLLRLIRGADAAGAAALRASEFEPGQSYCLVDARINEELRCATVVQICPKQRLILGGVYPTKTLEASNGLAYLEFLRNPKLATESRNLDSGLSVLLLTEGAVLRSATLDDLTHLTAEQNYVRLHLSNGECTLVRGPLQKYEDALPECFVRASRHLIINLRNVERLRRVSRDLGIVYFVNATESVRLGRKASAIVRTALLSRSRLPMNRSYKRFTPDSPID